VELYEYWANVYSLELVKTMLITRTHDVQLGFVIVC